MLLTWSLVCYLMSSMLMVVFSFSFYTSPNIPKMLFSVLACYLKFLMLTKLFGTCVTQHFLTLSMNVFWHSQHSPTLLIILNVHWCYSSLINVIFIVWCSQLANWHSLVLLAFSECNLNQTKTLLNYNLSFQVYIFIRTIGLKQLKDVHKDT